MLSLILSLIPILKTLKECRDEDWDIFKMWHELTTRRPKEKNIGYAESHDQALVGDKTIIFWLADKEMYYCMEKTTPVSYTHLGATKEKVKSPICLQRSPILL